MDTIMRIAPVIPVLVIDRVQDARPIAEALIEGGLPVLEVTLRTPCALEAIQEMRGVPGTMVGAGTVLNAALCEQALSAGAQFVVSPGLTDALAHTARDYGVPYLPGVATAGDIMRGLDLGVTRFKFFPAQASGGIAALRSIASAFGDVRFCPTGGITQQNVADWLSLPQVLCVGGSWLVKSQHDLDAVRAAAYQASQLSRVRSAAV